MKNSKGMVAYGLGKSLIFRLAELMNEEAKGTNIVTSVIVPSTIDTPQNRATMPDADFNKWVNTGSHCRCYLFSLRVMLRPVLRGNGDKSIW